MKKKELAIFIGAGAVSLVLIIITVLIVLALGHKEPINIVTTNLTDKMGRELLKSYYGIEDSLLEQYIIKKDLDDAYLALLEDETDMILVTDVNKDVVDFIKSKSIEFEKYVIGKDALVVLNNKLNPVENLKTSELKKIYEGEFSNWNEAKGEDRPIVAYYSDEELEETCMLNNFLGNDFKAAPMYRPMDNSFETLANSITKYLDTRKGALGYTTYYNIKNNEVSEDIRILNIDGVKAEKSTILSDRYPASMNIYAVIRKDKLSDSNIITILNYILSQQGQNIIEESGYLNKGN